MSADHYLSVWILGDQLLAEHPALLAAEQDVPRDHIRVLLVESRFRTTRMNYHRKKLTLLFSSMRHYAQELAEDGYVVDYRVDDSFVRAIQDHVEAYGPARFFTMEASAYGGRRFQNNTLQDLVGIPVTVVPNTQFLTGQYDPYPDPVPGKRYVMEHFYRKMRKHHSLLVDGSGDPVDGQWNYDKQNRKPLPRNVEPPPILRFPPDEITLTVMEEIQRQGIGFGAIDGFDMAVSREQAQQAFQDFLQHRLRDFGPYEDAMSTEHTTLYHSVLSPYINLGLLEPLPLAKAVEAVYHAGDAPINSVEGFIRQIVGWREFIYWQYWRSMPGLLGANTWQARRRLPRWFWDAHTEMNCLNKVTGRVIEDGYVHHIERLMVICNFALLAEIEPKAVNDWFNSTFIDAYEWVMAPNVLGMGLNADGGIIATKPYIASANYINKMSDYCRSCRYNHKARTGPDACPFNTLYWRFLIKHESKLRADPRLGRNVLGLRYLDEAERHQVMVQGDEFVAEL